MSLEIIRTIRDKDTEITNHITFENGRYIHKQIEKVDGKVFMRIKARRMIDISST